MSESFAPEPQSAPANGSLKTSAAVEVFSTAPVSGSGDPQAYLRNLADVARWSEAAGCKGILIYTDNNQLDPWLVCQMVIQQTTRLCPLVATQPVYMHPYTVAKMITSLGHLYGRQIYLNMVAGGFKNDLIALNDTTPHDERYERMVEYTTIVQRLCASPAPVTFAGRFYRVENLMLKPPLAAHLKPGVLLSGSSDAGLAAAKALGATAVQYPDHPKRCPVRTVTEGSFGVRVGIIARADSSRAWEIAHQRFPEDRRGQIAHQLAMKTSDSAWHKQLSRVAENSAGERDPYWLHPFQNYKTFCPYLVGDYQEVATELGRYIAAGYYTFILDIPPSEEELGHIGIVFEQAGRLAPAPKPASPPA